MSRAATLAIALAAAGCHRTRGPGLDRDAAAARFERITLDTHGEHGLSGLAVDGDGALWSVAERGASLWKITLAGGAATTARFAIRGLPDGEDLEAIAVVPGGFLVGTEGREAGVARAFRLVADGDGYRVEGAPDELRGDELGVRLGDNQGTEGACAAGATAFVAIETVGRDARGRWAPIVAIDRAAGTRAVQRLRLTTETGKISALDCWLDGDRVRAVAIERHFDVTRILAFELGGAGEIAPRVAEDLAPVLRGSLNLEGIARLPDGRIAAVVDNQYGGVTGPDEVLVWRAPLDLGR